MTHEAEIAELHRLLFEALGPDKALPIWQAILNEREVVRDSYNKEILHLRRKLVEMTEQCNKLDFMTEMLEASNNHAAAQSALDREESKKRWEQHVRIDAVEADRHNELMKLLSSIASSLVDITSEFKNYCHYKL